VASLSSRAKAQPNIKVTSSASQLGSFVAEKPRDVGGQNGKF